MDEGPLEAALLWKTQLCGKRPFRATPRESRPSRHGDLRHRLMARSRYCRRSSTSSLASVETEIKPCHGHTELLQGWKKLAPNYARPPLPSVGLMAMVGTALHANLTPFALPTMIGFSGYLRPATNAYRPPTPVPGPRKTLAFDSPWTTWSAPWIAALPRRPDRTQKPGPEKRLQTLVRRLVSPTLQEGNSSPATHHHAHSRDDGLRTDHRKLTSGISCTANVDSHAATRRSLQTAFKHCPRSTEQHFTFLDLSAPLCTSR